MQSKSSPFFIVGAGSFAQKLSLILGQHTMPHAFVDEQKQGEFCGKQVLRASELQQMDCSDAYFFIAISFTEHAQQAITRLLNYGATRAHVYQLQFDSDAQLLDDMLRYHRDKFLTQLAFSNGCFVALQRSFFEKAYSFLAEYQASEKKTPSIAFQSIGRGGGYTKHFANLPSRCAELANCVFVSDTLGNAEKAIDVSEGFISNSISDLPHIPMSQSAMLKHDGFDLIISAHVFLSAPKTVKRLSLVHMVHDVLLFESQTLDYLDAYSTHYLFLPSAQSFKMYQQLCLAHQFSNNIVLIPGGYPRHDVNLDIYKRKAQSQTQTDCILYAPTLSSIHGSNEIDACYSVIQAAQYLPSLLDNHPQLTLIFRPHPEDLELRHLTATNSRMAALQKLIAWCEAHPRCQIDAHQNDYLDSFARSSMMLSDTSSVAMSYALITQKPLIFLSSNHVSLGQHFPDSAFIRDRDKIGYLAQTMGELEALLQRFEKTKHSAYDNAVDEKTARDKQNQLAKLLFNQGHSEAYLLAHLHHILQDIKHPDWWYLQDHLEHHSKIGVI